MIHSCKKKQRTILPAGPRNIFLEQQTKKLWHCNFEVVVISDAKDNITYKIQNRLVIYSYLLGKTRHL